MTETSPALQQPTWPDPLAVHRIRAELRRRPPVVGWAEVARLRDLLAAAARGEVGVLQAGDCAEDPAESDVDSVRHKVDMLDVLADVMGVGAGVPVLRVGRIAGQYAKPRSAGHETYRGVRLPVYRGPMVNGIDPTPAARVPDPGRLLAGHTAATRVCLALKSLRRSADADPVRRVWTSHEALLLDYEEPLVRSTLDGGLYLASTHWPWIGNRTRDPRGAHVALLSGVDNPVACKVSGELTEADLLELCARLDPRREPGRLTLIARFGAARVDALGAMVRAVRRAGHPVLWLCDPMHGNTIRGADGLKLRRLADIVDEIRGFVRVVTAQGGVCAGLHMEASPADIGECDGGGVVPAPGPAYRTLCDPRLNLTQAASAAAHWLPAVANETRGEFRLADTSPMHTISPLAPIQGGTQ